MKKEMLNANRHARRMLGKEHGIKIIGINPKHIFATFDNGIQLDIQGVSVQEIAQVCDELLKRIEEKEENK